MIKVFRCDGCVEPCVLTVLEDNNVLPDTCPYSKITISTVNFVELKE